ncbi:MAG: M23 family metallopeptidase [Halopseudomonas aestusnigri]
MNRVIKVFIIQICAVVISLGHVSADDFVKLSFPLDCTPNKNCFVQKYVDMAQGKNQTDYRCGSLSNDGHKGTDIRLLNIASMEKGVAVLAAADGKVIDARDYMPDVSSILVSDQAVRSRGYGNLVTLQHADGTVTVYAHMKRGSLLVTKGEYVNKSQHLGMVGLSGLTEFPHLHFEVVRGNRRLDPFSGGYQETGCVSDPEPLWTDEVTAQLTYQQSRIVHFGFSDQPLSRHAMEYGLLAEKKLPRKAKNIILNVYVIGIQAGDRWVMQITKNGKVTPFVKADDIYGNTKFIVEQYIGKAGKGRMWEPGTYTGEYKLYRSENSSNKKIILQATTSIEVK